MCMYVYVCASPWDLLCVRVCNSFFSFVSGACSKCPFGGDAAKGKPADSKTGAGAADDSEDSEPEITSSDPESEVELDMEGKSGAINRGEKNHVFLSNLQIILIFTRRH